MVVWFQCVWSYRIHRGNLLARIKKYRLNNLRWYGVVKTHHRAQKLLTMFPSESKSNRYFFSQPKHYRRHFPTWVYCLYFIQRFHLIRKRFGYYKLLFRWKFCHSYCIFFKTASSCQYIWSLNYTKGKINILHYHAPRKSIAKSRFRLEIVEKH